MRQKLNKSIAFDFNNAKTGGVFRLENNGHIARRISIGTGVQKSSANEQKEKKAVQFHAAKVHKKKATLSSGFFISSKYNSW